MAKPYRDEPLPAWPPATLVDLLRYRAAERGAQEAFLFLTDGEEEAERLTYAELDARARSVGALLTAHGLAGQRVLLLFPAGLDFVAAFFGCLYAGAVAVPAYPPRGARVSERLVAIAADCRPRAALTVRALAEKADAAGFGGLPVLAIEDAVDVGFEPPAGLTGETLAFLQYTSGSTGTPKGVCVSHGNLLHNEAMIRDAFGMHEASVVVGWLPLYHDMGLIGNVLQPVYAGGRCVLMSPTAFLQRPLRWLEAISRYRGTTSGGPNFAYELVRRRATDADKAALDLSAWTLAYNGAEPVRAATLDAFAADFAACGFRREAFYPCYGLAEATLFASGGRAAEPGGASFRVARFDAAALERDQAVPPAEGGDVRELVSCGVAWAEQELAIADPQSLAELPEGRVGEIWLAGPSVAGGYWKKPEETARDFGARLADQPERGPFLRTGDLGFFVGGELFVAGRLKDLIILRGRNLYPQDLELTAERAHPELRSGCAAAFAFDEGHEERLGLVIEIDRRSAVHADPAAAAPIFEAIREALARDHEAAAHTIALLPPSTLPKTSSGKVQRRAARAALAEGKLPVLALSRLGEAAESAPNVGGTLEGGTLQRGALPARAELLALPAEERRAALVAALAAEAGARLGMSAGRVSPSASLAALGLDSLGAIELAAWIEARLGVAPEAFSLLEGASLESVAGWLAERLVEGPAAPTVELAAEEREAPASFGQQALWYLHRLAPTSAAYNLFGAADLEGPVDASALERAFAALVARHPVLRTRYEERADGVFQRIEPADAQALDWLSVDASSWDEGQVDTFLSAEAHEPYDLEQLGVLRVRLLLRGAGRATLLVGVHHVAADFWSLTVLLGELGALYEAARDGRPLALPPLSGSYAAFARRQRERLAGPIGEELGAFWSRALAGPLEPLELPADRPRPAVASYAGGAVARTLPPALAAGVEQAAAALGSTPYAVLLGAFSALLARWSGQPTVHVGTPAVDREGGPFEGVVGYCINPVVLRAELGGDPTAAEHLGNVRQTALAAFAHRGLPFDRLVERLRPERRAGESPIFQALFSYQRAPRQQGRLAEQLGPFALNQAGGQLELGGLTWRSRPVAVRSAQMDLALAAAPVAQGLGLSLVFARDLYDEATMVRLLASFEALLTDALRRSGKRVSELALLSRAERQHVLSAWNQTAQPAPAAETVHELFFRQAALRPSEPALVFPQADGERTLTFAELEERVRSLAARLRAAGVRAETPVGLACERSPEMVVAALAIQAAGGCYVPLDLAYPEDRLRFMVEDAWAAPGARILLTRAADRARLGALAGLAELVLDVDAVEEAVGAGTVNRPAVELPTVDRGQLAYVIYTSGSTGRPKGVAIEHRAVANFLDAMSRAPGFGPGQRLLAITTLAFDIAGLELFLPLAVGGTIVLASRELAADGARLGTAVAEHRIDLLQATPATWRLLLEAGWRSRPGLTMLAGGEAVPAELAARLTATGGTLWNVYGPTETTIWSAARAIAPGEAPVVVGGAIANTQIHVLDARQEPCPVGLPGEIWIGGLGLARGYRGRPGLTADRFRPDPFAAAESAGARLYRVGDRARRRADGTLEFLGRVDHQIKLRGYRIELGEIESVLAAHPAIGQGVVVLATHDEPRLVGFVVGRDGGAVPEPAELRTFLRARLPEYMVPAVTVALAELPLTPNGKVDRRALVARAASLAVVPVAAAPRAATGELEREIAEAWCAVLGLPSVGLEESFFDVGGHSLLLAQLQRRLAERLDRPELTVVDLLRHPTVAAQARFLGGDAPVLRTERPASGAAGAVGDIAIIGVAGRFPGAPDVRAFWRNLVEGVESLTHFTAEELAESVPAATLADPAYVRSRGVLAEGESFDAGFFGLTPREAEVLDPQHRVFLECAWEALETAGYDPGRYAGRIGLFASAAFNTYLLHVGEEAMARAAGGYQAFIANDKDFVPSRVAYKLDLRGPAVNVQTACSSSLVAVHLACRSIAAGESDMALAGGVALRTPQEQGYLYEPGGILSPDGHCRAFDAAAGGTVVGSGVGLVLLKPLARALADGDDVWAVVKGSAINNDGAAKVGYTAPSIDGQATVLRDALAAAGVEPGAIDYVEAHGTGTELGDPIEAAALVEALGAGEAPCAVGAVKSNVGHLDTAAGIAGLIKTVLALRHETLPPTLHFSRLNPKVPFAGTRFAVQAERAPWPRRADRPRRAGVSSFGIGGTNCHVVLEEAPVVAAAAAVARPELLLLSARSEAALDVATARLGERLAEGDLALGDVAFTLATGRRSFEHRRFLVAQDAAEAARLLAARDEEHLRTARAAQGDRAKVVFLLSGQGSQYPGMARGLHATEPAFQGALEAALAAFEPALAAELRPLLLEPPSESQGGELAQTRLTQPALFAVEWALAALWRSWGVEPVALVGHSIGELVAATLAGVFDLTAGARLVAERGRLMQAAEPGSMVAVELPEADLLADLPAGLALAAVNGPRDCVVAGPSAVLDAFAAGLDARGVPARRLHTSHAFHSPSMASAAVAFEAAVARVPRQAPRIPIVSNATGTWLTAEQAQDPAYWGGLLTAPVRFGAGVATAAEAAGTVLLEVGPGRALATLARRQLTAAATVTSLPHPQDRADGAMTFATALGRLWQLGVPLGWASGWAARGAEARRVALPTYPFERKRYLLAPGKRSESLAPTAPPLAAASAPEAWFWAPVWRQQLAVEPLPASPRPWYLVGDGVELTPLAERLRADGRRVVLVPEAAELRAALAQAEAPPERVVLVAHGEGETAEALVERALAVIQALPEPVRAPGLGLVLVSRGAQRVLGREKVEPAGAVLWGLAPVAAQELAPHTVRVIDLPADAPADPEMLEDWAAELASSEDPAEVALRGGTRFVRAFEPRPLAASEGGLPRRLAPRAVVLVTGGLGAVGLGLAEGLAATGAAPRLVLTSRSGEAGPQAQAALGRLEAAGAEVLTLPLEVENAASWQALLAAVHARFGPVEGVVHAAGVAGGGLLARRTAAEARAVLAPKVPGTLQLAASLAGEPLAFAVLCSSITGLVGGFAQGDYAAANAFLDAWAAQGGAGRPWTVSLAWDRFRGLGMAGGADHPLLGARLVDDGSRRVFRQVYEPESQWVLSEHGIAGRPTVPGATYLEMARAAWGEAGAVAIEDVVFLAPLAVDAGEAREVLSVLEKDGGAWRFTALSRPLTGEAELPWTEHARARVSPSTAEAPPAVALEELAALFPRELPAEEAAAKAKAAESFLATGRRWQSLERVHLSTDGESELLAELALPAELVGDLARFALHPALLDIAVGYLQLARPGHFLPLAYERLELFAPLPQRFQSWLTLRAAEAEDTLRCDAVLFAEDGTVCARVVGFAMKKVGDTALAGLRQATREPRPPVRGVLDGTLSAAQAGEVLRRVLAAPGRLPASLVVSPRPLPALAEAFRRFDPASLVASLPIASGALAAPAAVLTAEGLPALLTEVWQRYLGLPHVGPHDNFFELGGTSLVGVQVIGELRRQLGREIPTVALFEAPTIAALARYLAPPPSAAPAFERTRARIAAKQAALASRRRRPRPFQDPVSLSAGG